MRLEITRIEGLRNDLLLRLERSEIERSQLSVANRDRLMTLPGMPRHRDATDDEAQGIAEAKLPIEATSSGSASWTARARRGGARRDQQPESRYQSRACRLAARRTAAVVPDSRRPVLSRGRRSSRSGAAAGLR